MLKIRRPLGRLIFNIGIAIPGKTVFLIETAPWMQADLIKWYILLSKVVKLPRYALVVNMNIDCNNMLCFESHIAPFVANIIQISTVLTHVALD